jgi:hypothetical protein
MLGYGGFGVVQLIELNGKKVACKQVKSNDENDITYFRAELALIKYILIFFVFLFLF